MSVASASVLRLTLDDRLVHVQSVLREIEDLAFQLRSLVAESPAAEVARFDAALARLRAAKPRIEDLMGSGDPPDYLREST